MDKPFLNFERAFCRQNFSLQTAPLLEWLLCSILLMPLNSRLQWVSDVTVNYLSGMRASGGVEATGLSGGPVS